MKRFLSFLLVIVLIIPVVTILNGCDKANVTVKNVSELQEALTGNKYDDAKIILGNDLLIDSGVSLTISDKKTLDLDEYVLTVNGSLTNNGKVITTSKILGSGTFTNNGTVQANVNSVNNLTDAFEYANEISLSGDIINLNGDEYISDISLNCTNKNYEFSLDLNGHKLGAELNIINYINGSYTNYGATINIKNSGEKSNAVMGLDNKDCWYGLMVKGNDKINVTANNVTFLGDQGGIYSNGLCDGAKVIATNCTFNGLNSTSGVGAYLAGNYNYNFTNCEFNGATGYYSKSGTHVLKDCMVKGTNASYSPANYNGNGAEPTGSALVVDSNPGYIKTLNVTIDGGTYESTSGYAIEEVSTYKTQSEKVSYANVTYTENTTLRGAIENILTVNNSVTKV